MKRAMTKTIWSALLVTLTLALGARAQTLDTRTLPVTTSYLGNTLNRGPAWGATIQPSAQRYVMEYFSALTATPEGYVFGTTTWEEGGQHTGVYREGDCLHDAPWDTSGTTIAASAQHLLIGADNGQKVRVYKRVAGKAVDGKGGAMPGTMSEYTVSDQSSMMMGAALDEKNDKFYVLFPALNRIKVFKLSDGTPITDFPIQTPAPARTPAAVPAGGGRLAVDGDGNLWAIQGHEDAALTKVNGTPSGSAAADKTALANAFDDSNETQFSTKDPNGCIALDFGTLKPISAVYLTGREDWKNVKLQGADDPNGPWTDLYTSQYTPGGWPSQWITVDEATPHRCLRFTSAATFTIARFEAYTKSTPENGKVLKFSPDGQKLAPEIAIDNPGDLAWDAKNKRLLVSDNGHAQQVLAYTNMNAPQLDPTFGTAGKLGVRNGVYAGVKTELGKVGPGRFDGIRGVGVDAQGNVYVGMCGSSTGVNQTRLEAYTPAGKQLWHMSGLSFEDHAIPDPLDETSLYSSVNRFKMDYSKPAGNEWTYVASTINGAYKYDDPRGYIHQLRRIGGQLYLITGSMSADDMVYRFNRATDGEIGIPMAMFHGLNTGTPFPPNQPLGIGRVLWVDKNGDGKAQANEYDKTNGYATGGQYFDEEGNFWYIPVTDTPQTIRKLGVSRPDKNGVVSWAWDSPRNGKWAMPVPFDTGYDGASIGMLAYDPSNKTLFVTGYNKSYPKTSVGTNRLLVSYAVAGNTLKEMHQVVLPHDVNIGDGDHDTPYAISIAGDYVFIGYHTSMTTRVYRKSDLSFVGQLHLGLQTSWPSLDGTAVVNAFKRPKVNEYLLFYSNYVANSIIMLRWKPEVKDTPNAPMEFKIAPNGAAALNLKWNASTSAEGYKIERMDNTPNGWTEWKQIAQVGDETSFTDRNLKPRTYAYRVRAFNTVQSGGNSDYSWSVFITPGTTP